MKTTYPHIRKPLERTAVKQEGGGESQVQQNMKDEQDVNGIMDKWRRSGDPTIFHKTNGAFIDATEAVDYQTALNTIKDAEAAFSDLPSSLRKELDNSPAKFLEFMHDPANMEKMLEYGLVENPVAAADAAETPVANATETPQKDVTPAA